MLRKLAGNTLFGLVGTTAQRALLLVTTLVLARGLGQDGFGTYSFVGIFIFFFAFVVDLGMERVVTRELSQAPRRIGRIIGNAIVLKLTLSAVAIPAACFVAWLMGVPSETRYCIFVAALGLPLSIEALFRAYFQSQYEAKYIYAVTFPGGVLFLALIGICLAWSLPLYAVFYAALASGAVTLTFLMALTWRRIRPVLWPDLALQKALLQDAAEVGLFVLLFMLSLRIDQILLFKLRGAVEVGRYAVAVRITEALSILPEGLMMTVFPVLASSLHSAPERFHHTYRLSFKYLSAVILPIALLLTMTRLEFVQIVFGQQYSNSAEPLALLAWGMFFAYTGAVYLNLFIVQHRQRLLLFVSVIAMSVNIIANLVLIPSYGATGAALAMVIGNLAGFACWTLHPATAPFMSVCIAEAARPLVAVGLAWLVATLSSLHGIAAAGLALLIYVGCMALSGGFSRSDIDLVRRLFAAEPPASTEMHA